MGQLRIAAVVEGYGEVAAVPVLVRHILDSVGVYSVEVRKPHRIPRSAMTTPRVRDAVKIQRAAVGPEALIIVLLDSDDDDPEKVAERVKNQVEPEDANVCVAVREYEAWFLASADSLKGHRTFRKDVVVSGDPEKNRDAKGRLEKLMCVSYKETIHQAAFSQLIDVDVARSSSESFESFYETVTEWALGRCI